MPDKPPSLRERQAQLTRDEILNAARRLFAERGYTRTSVRDIAEAAGVSAQTVYDSIGTKQALVARLNDLVDAEADIAGIVRGAAQASDPAQVVAVSARITRSILENCGDIVHALVTGAAAEPELAVVLAEGHRRHVEGAATVIGLLQELDALDDSVDVSTAAQSLAAVSDFRFAMLLQDSYGWSLERIESWIAATSSVLLLGPGTSKRR
ncbi:TetR/AcrR family transcriptional regulator [Angustibacter sp. McL0619]|uniref:TetR/AcrR family transcriptional regulator n=1 Tax=Angustibacter sp. McL0619 TaxID=3415676 RepID=UPI003CF46F8C